MEDRNSKTKILVYVTIGVVGVALFAFASILFLKPKKTSVSETVVPTEKEVAEEVKDWKEEGVVVPGNYADADIIQVEGGYRIYYGLEPEVAGFKNQVYTAFSTDGKIWTDNKEIMTGVGFPSVIKTATGYRMYFQGNANGKSGIMTAISTDGIIWTKEAGYRLIAPANYEGEVVENIAAPTVEKMENGTYLMVYRLSLSKKYSPEVPNQTTSFFLYATSTDGMTWAEKGIAIDSRNETLQGMIDGPELLKEDGKYRVYFWSYGGIYNVTYEGGQFGNPTFEFQKSDTPKGVQFAPNPPGDPTLITIGDKLYMYYGQHQKGIYLAIK